MVPSSRRGRGFRLPRARRITRGTEIRSLFRRGKRSKTDTLDVLHAASPAGFSRLGFVVPLHRHGTADRNRLKRRLREIGRLELLPRLDENAEPVDVLIRARREAYDVDFTQLRGELTRWIERQWPTDSRSE